MEEVKFTEEEQLKIKIAQNEIGQIIFKLGQLEIEKNNTITTMEKLKSDLLQKHGQLFENQQVLLKSITDKYGEGSYNPDTGAFTPIENKE
jgi:hypothetical protein